MSSNLHFWEKCGGWVLKGWNHVFSSMTPLVSLWKCTLRLFVGIGLTLYPIFYQAEVKELEGSLNTNDTNSMFPPYVLVDHAALCEHLTTVKELAASARCIVVIPLAGESKATFWFYLLNIVFTYVCVIKLKCACAQIYEHYCYWKSPFLMFKILE